MHQFCVVVFLLRCN